MPGTVFVAVTMSLDGYIAPESMDWLAATPAQLEQDTRLERCKTQWLELHQQTFPQRFFRENLKLGDGGEEGRENDRARESFERVGTSIMGKRMFDAGEHSWPEEAPFHTPVYVLTHERREPWERPGGTTFHFVDEGIEPVLARAREAAGDRDVKVAGGAETIVEYLNAGLVDELSITVSPVLFGSGVRLFRGLDAHRVALEPIRAETSARVTHLTYAVWKR